MIILELILHPLKSMAKFRSILTVQDQALVKFQFIGAM